MNEAETRAEHIDPALKAAGWGVVEGSRIRREYPITLGPPRRPRAARQAADRRLRAGLSQHQAGRVEAKAWDEELTEGVAQARTTPASWPSASPMPPTARASTASTCRPARKAKSPRYPDAGRTLEPDLCRSRTPGATASPPCRSRTRAARIRAATTRTSPSSG